MRVPSLTQFKTLGEMLKWGEKAFLSANLFFGHGTDNAWDDAVALASYALHLPVPAPAEEASRVLAPEEKTVLLELFLRRIRENIPVPYLTKEAWFAGLKFIVDKRVIIPRSPIGQLIENGFQARLNPQKKLQILDLCTGSACIAIACSKFYPNSQVDAIDISASALEIAQQNLLLHHCQETVTLIQSDLFSSLPQKSYDVMISNPPYVDQTEMEMLPKEYQFEPSLALFGGKDGLDIVKKILSSASLYLKPDGLLIVEVGYSKPALKKLYPNVPFYWFKLSRGGSGIFLLTKAQLDQYSHIFALKG